MALSLVGYCCCVRSSVCPSMTMSFISISAVSVSNGRLTNVSGSLSTCLSSVLCRCLDWSAIVYRSSSYVAIRRSTTPTPRHCCSAPSCSSTTSISSHVSSTRRSRPSATWGSARPVTTTPRIVRMKTFDFVSYSIIASSNGPVDICLITAFNAKTP